jgi:4-hydroxybenzoate adenylyltransferase
VSLMEDRARSGGWLHRPAFVTPEGIATHADVHDRAARTASLLSELGVGRGDRVLMALADGMELVSMFLGAVRLGAVAIPVNPRLTADDHRRLEHDARPRAVVCPGALADRFGPTRVTVAEDLAALAANLPPLPAAAVGPDAPAYAQYTSGTTGNPKAAVHRHGDPPVYARAFAEQAIALRPDDVVLSVSKMYFAYGLGNSLFFPLLTGARAVLHAGLPNPDDIAALVERHGVSVLFAVPTFFARTVAQARPEAFGSLRVTVSAGEPLLPALAERARAFFGCPILDGVGSTEVGQTFASNSVACWRDGTVGRPLPPYEVTVVDEAGRPLPPGREGALWVKGPTVLLEYLDQTEATEAARRGEWLQTGDRAVIDADGFVRLRGRVDDLEKVGGITVAPQEVEAVLATHQAVTEVAVAVVRDGHGASRLEAFVVLAPGHPEPHLVAEELLVLARSRLAPFKVPRVVRLVDALPRTPTGKLRRFVLRSGALSGDDGPYPGAPSGQ